MSDDEKPDGVMTPDDVQQYLKKIQRTVKESEALIEMAELRIAETDRFLAKHGMTREAASKLLDNQSLTPEQEKYIDEQIAEWEAELADDMNNIRAQFASDNNEPEDELEQRSRKLAEMRRQFRL